MCNVMIVRCLFVLCSTAELTTGVAMGNRASSPPPPSVSEATVNASDQPEHGPENGMTSSSTDLCCKLKST